MFLLYKFFTFVLYPLFILIIHIRKIIGKEDPIRFKEKLLQTKIINSTNEKKTLIWFHGASIGEITSILPIVEYLNEKNKNLFILITTVTLSSGKIVSEKFKDNKNILHQFFPLDVPHITKKFLDKWNPNIVAFIDSEIWPNFIYEIKKRKKPLLLLNGRITKKSYRRWKFLKNFAKEIFSSFNSTIVSSRESLNYLEKLGSKEIKYFGNLKFMSKTDNHNRLSPSIENNLNNYKVWCASNTHEGEDSYCINVHKNLKKHYSNTLTIIIPRHIDRVEDIFLQCTSQNLKTQVINKDDEIKKDTEIIIINSYGILPKYYNYCKSIFLGKSLLKKFSFSGGQNPIEAAKSGCKIYYGPYVNNFNEVYDYLETNRIAKKVTSYDELANNLVEDLKQPKKIDRDNIVELNKFGEKVFNNTIKEIEKFV